MATSRIIKVWDGPADNPHACGQTVLVHGGDYKEVFERLNARDIYKFLQKHCVGHLDTDHNRSVLDYKLAGFSFDVRMSWPLEDLRISRGESRYSHKKMTEEEWQTIMGNGVNTTVYMSVYYDGYYVIHDRDITLQEAVDYILNM